MVDENDITQGETHMAAAVAYDGNASSKAGCHRTLQRSSGRSAYDKFGHFNTDLRIAADYEILFRFLYKEQYSRRSTYRRSWYASGSGA